MYIFFSICTDLNLRIGFVEWAKYFITESAKWKVNIFSNPVAAFYVNTFIIIPNKRNNSEGSSEEKKVILHVFINYLLMIMK